MGIFGWVFLAVLVLLIIFAISIYNRLVRLRALVKEGFSGITVQLRRRADLIPNLVQTVQGYATHEREVFDEVTARRAEATNAGSVEATAAADAHMTGLLSRLFAVAEAYPELKANTNFLQLQDQLAKQLGLEHFDSDEHGDLPAYVEGMARIEREHPLATVAEYVDHIVHMVEVAGIDHVGIAADFDGGGGVTGWQDASETPNVTAELRRRGFSEADIAKIWGGNLLRAWQAAIDAADPTP